MLNYITKLKRNPLFIKSIPIDTLNMMPRHFFNIHTLNQLHYVSLPTHLYRLHFGHIPLYYIEDLNLITWCPNQLLSYLNYYTINRIYLINDDDYVIILPNYTLKLI